MLKSLFGSRPAFTPAKLPQRNSSVDVIVGGRPARTVTVDECSEKGIVTREVVGRAGEPAVFVYAAPAGRFRLQTKISGVRGNNTYFDPPKRVELVGAASSAQKRSSVRLDALVNGAWRFAPNGKGTGEYTRATIQDISRGGCALNTDRELRAGTLVEVKLNLREGKPPLILLGEVMRHHEIRTSGKHSHGLRFHGVRPEEDNAIIEFINRKQSELRSRGLA
ncbi:MAG: PilZ domain-containing protein [Candidatus Eremiobacteraeota bacterium]|nr:PilZ domain-containing protein [Candidatus Eremiobacteraeota bacterium]